MGTPNKKIYILPSLPIEKELPMLTFGKDWPHGLVCNL